MNILYAGSQSVYCYLQLNYEHCMCLISKSAVSHVTALSTVLMEAFACVEKHNKIFEQTIMLRNKPTAIAMSNACGFVRS